MICHSYIKGSSYTDKVKGIYKYINAGVFTEPHRTMVMTLSAINLLYNAITPAVTLG